tara:strand:+ start:1843 stop:2472 length:630 start_codon:yes stop_codon:yes gene_type:complete
MKAILRNGSISYASRYKVIYSLDGVKTYTVGATNQQWLDWGFKDVVEPVYDSVTQLIGDYYETATQIKRTITDKTKEIISAELDDAKKNTIRIFESDTDDLIREVVGARANEYLLAEEESIAFKAAGYPDLDVPSSVSSDAIANGTSNQISCDSILAMATNWRAAQSSLRANRLLSKAQVKAVTLVSQIAPIKADWDGFLTTLKTQITA